MRECRLNSPGSSLVNRTMQRTTRLAIRFAAFALVLASSLARAAEGPIHDNSFLIEEAYNQEEGVVQHINTFQRFRNSGDWVYTFTQEWPVGGLTHQFSYTVPVVRPGDGHAGVGDVALNSRYQRR